MDYAEQTKTGNLVSSFTYFEYLKLKRKPPKVETKPRNFHNFNFCTLKCAQLEFTPLTFSALKCGNITDTRTEPTN